MLRIRDYQLSALSRDTSAAFEAHMLGHIERYFAPQLTRATVPDLVDLIREGIDRAANHRISRGPNVSRYITLLLLFGHRFDEDPIYPEAREALEGSGSERQRMLALMQWAHPALEQRHGEQREHFLAALERARTAVDDDLRRPGGVPLVDHWRELLRWLHPVHADVAGAAQLDGLIDVIHARTAQRAYSELEATIYLLFAFLLGWHFEDDAQYRWLVGGHASPEVWLRRARAYLAQTRA